MALITPSQWLTLPLEGSPTFSTSQRCCSCGPERCIQLTTAAVAGSAAAGSVGAPLARVGGSMKGSACPPSPSPPPTARSSSRSFLTRPTPDLALPLQYTMKKPDCTLGQILSRCTEMDCLCPSKHLWRAVSCHSGGEAGPVLSPLGVAAGGVGRHSSTSCSQSTILNAPSKENCKKATSRGNEAEPWQLNTTSEHASPTTTAMAGWPGPDGRGRPRSKAATPRSRKAYECTVSTS
eukprot:COSAG01_NODE_3142_length_6523_cov_8.041252_2_plen_236_part_00